jgi:hypothetical protein
MLGNFLPFRIEGFYYLEANKCRENTSARFNRPVIKLKLSIRLWI